MNADDPAHQDFEVQWWGDCSNTFSEETKQLTYAHRMGLVQVRLGEKWPIYDLGHRDIIDVGGGPVSLLLKCVSAGRGSTVVDPATYPAWTTQRYEHCGIHPVRARAEDWLHETDDLFDEAWCYNVLQHVVDPERIVAGMRRVARRIRIFEWIDLGPSLGHPQTLRSDELDRWLAAEKGHGKTEQVNENGCIGPAYYGVFDYGRVP